MSDSFTPRGNADDGHEKLGRDELLAILRDAIDQRDKLVSQFEAMALQVDESVREIDDARLDAQHQAEKAEESERRAQQDALRVNDLARALEEERRKYVELAAEFAAFREEIEQAPIEDPWRILRLAIAQIASNWIFWLRGKFPPDSPLLPWFDRAVEGTKRLSNLTWKCAVALYAWMKPRLAAFFGKVSSEAARRMSKK